MSAECARLAVDLERLLPKVDAEDLDEDRRIAFAEAALSKIAALEASSALMHQRVGMQFDHLLFEEVFLTHPQTTDPAFASPEAAAVAFWLHDARAEALLSPEINPLIWADFRGDSSLQEAGRFWLVQKLFHVPYRPCRCPKTRPNRPPPLPSAAE